MPAAREGDRVRITYSVTLEDGTVYDFSESRDPLEFTIGENETIPALGTFACDPTVQFTDHLSAIFLIDNFIEGGDVPFLLNFHNCCARAL